MRRLLKWLLLASFLVVAALVIRFAIWYSATGGEWTSDDIKPSSPFHRYVEPFDREQEEAIRVLAIAELPPGSDLPTIHAFIERHFTKEVVFKKQTASLATGHAWEPVPHIHLQAWSSGRFPSGSDYVEFMFVLDDADRLKDIQISCNGDWL